MPGEALISFEEAEQLAVAHKKSGVASSRTVLLATTGIIITVVATLLILTLLSLRGAKTGLSTILPFLDRAPPRTLQVN